MRPSSSVVSLPNPAVTAGSVRGEIDYSWFASSTSWRRVFALYFDVIPCYPLTPQHFVVIHASRGACLAVLGRRRLPRLRIVNAEETNVVGLDGYLG